MEPFNKTSNVDLSAKDSRGRTIIHHMMRTCEYGTYQNEAMLKLFHELGVPLDTKDSEGKSPLDYALEAGSYIMSELLQSLQGIKKPQMVCSCYILIVVQGMPVRRPVHLSVSLFFSWNVCEDSIKYTAKTHALCKLFDLKRNICTKKCILTGILLPTFPYSRFTECMWYVE